MVVVLIVLVIILLISLFAHRYPKPPQNQNFYGPGGNKAGPYGPGGNGYGPGYGPGGYGPPVGPFRWSGQPGFGGVPSFFGGMAAGTLLSYLLEQGRIGMDQYDAFGQMDPFDMMQSLMEQNIIQQDEIDQLQRQFQDMNGGYGDGFGPYGGFDGNGGDVGSFGPDGPYDPQNGIDQNGDWSQVDSNPPSDDGGNNGDGWV